MLKKIALRSLILKLQKTKLKKILKEARGWIASLGAHVGTICLQRRVLGFNLWVRKIPLEKEVATHSSILAWRIPRTEPGGLQSMGSQRVGGD